MGAPRITLGAEARAALLAGVDAVADAVRVTLGPRGRAVVVGRPDALRVTTDGAAIARGLELDDPGARLIRTVAQATEQAAGDGTTTATVLAQAMIRAGLRHIAAGADPVALRRGIERAVAQAVEHLAERQAIGIAGAAQTTAVAAVAAKDQEIGAVVARAFEAVGADGVVNVERGDALALEVVDGMRFHQGSLSPHLLEGGETVLEDPFVLIANQEVTRAEQLVPVLERVAPTGRPLLVIADRVTGPALGVLVRNRDRVRAVAVKARHVGVHRRRHLEEVALFTGGQAIVDTLGMTVEQTQLSQLGRAERVAVTRSTTTIAGGAGDPAAVGARIRALRREIEAERDAGERSRLEERLAELAGAIAVIRFGAATETELAALHERIEDAVRATRAALREGIVPGGGVALLEAGEAIDASGRGEDERAGAALVRRALAAPLRQIAENAGFDGSVAVARTRALPAGEGLDVVTGDYGDVIDAGVLDPLLVVRTALQSAASVAGLVLATEGLVARDGDGSLRVRHGAPARAALRAGVDAVARAVAATLGPGGRTVALASDGRVVLAADGVTVARAIDLADPFEALGARLVREVAGAVGDGPGDGTTTATVLAQAIVAGGGRAIAAGTDPVALRRGIEHAVAQAAADVARRSVPTADLTAVATVAAGDHTLGAIVAEAFERVGRDGVVTAEPGHTRDVRLDVALGMHWEQGSVGGETVLEHPYVLCVDERIRAAEQVAPALELVDGRPLLLVVLGLDEEARRLLAANRVLAVTAPDFLDRRRRNLEDIALVTGGEAITEELGASLAYVRREQLGSARRVVATRTATTIVGGAGDPRAIEARAEGLRRELERDDELPFLRDRLRERLARLAGGVAAIQVGAPTEAEAAERLLRAEDAVHAARAALAEGVVPGGGVALLGAADAIDVRGLTPDEAAGARVVRRALEAPLRRIAANAGLEPPVERVRRDGLGLDAATGAYRDLAAAGIVDPALVVRSALEHAASIAKTVLLAECLVARS